MSGIVTDEAGLPIADAVVAVDYRAGGELSSPTFNCNQFGCSTSTQTDGGGKYDLMFEPGPEPLLGANIAGVMYSFREGYDPNIQVVPRETPEIVQNLRLRRVRSVDAGESIMISIEPDSSLCSDLEDWYILTSNCEQVAILVNQPGTLTVEARPAVAGGAIPVVFFATSGRYTSLQMLGPGTASVGVQAGERYRVFVGIPTGSATHRFDLSTSLR